MQALQDTPVGGRVELVVDRPHVIEPQRPQPLGRDRGFAQALALAPPARHPEPFFAPQALHALAVHAPALLEQPSVRPSVPPPRTVGRDLAQLAAQRQVIIGPQQLAALR